MSGNRSKIVFGLPGTLSSSDDEPDVLTCVPGSAGDFGLGEAGFERGEDRGVECFPALVGAGHVAAMGSCEPGQFVGHALMVAGWPSTLTMPSHLTYDDGMSNTEMVTKIMDAAPSMEPGQFAVIACGVSTDEWWNTGRTYASASTAFARQTREFNSLRCNAYVVKRHSAGYTVYLGPSNVLGVAPARSVVEG